MTLEQHIDFAAEQCSKAADVCLKVGDPFFPDSFKDILRAFAKNVLEDKDVEKPVPMTDKQKDELDAAYSKVLSAEQDMIRLERELKEGPERNALKDVVMKLTQTCNAFCDPRLT